MPSDLAEVVEDDQHLVGWRLDLRMDEARWHVGFWPFHLGSQGCVRSGGFTLFVA